MKRIVLHILRILIVLLASIPLLTLHAADRPNIVLIISDDHAWTDYGFMKHPTIQTPNLDRLQSNSLCFTRGYVTSSLCCPSLASIITGKYPHQHKITSNDPPRPKDMTREAFYKSPFFTDGRERMNQLLEESNTLPMILGKQGYASLQTGKWWQGNFARGGFTEGMTKGGRHGDDGLKIGRETMEPIFSFVDKCTTNNTPFLVWYAPLLPHDPHTPPKRLLDKYKNQTDSLPVAKYWAMVEWFDETIGQLTEGLEQRKLMENTIIVYIADNGWIQNPNSNQYAPKSKQSPYDGGLRTPILIQWKNRIGPRVSNDLAQSIDIVPTLLTALDLR